MMNNSKKLIMICSILFIVLCMLVFFCMNNSNKDVQFEDENHNSSQKEESTLEQEEIESSSELGPISLKIGKIRDIDGGQLMEVNDYEIVIPDELVKIGYMTDVKDNVLTIISKDNKYKFVMYQLTDNYKLPTESELEQFEKTEEAKKLEKRYDDDEIDFLEYYDQYEILQREYLNKLGYTKKDSPDYIMTEEELEQFRKGYILDGEDFSSGCSGIFPGDKCYQSYSWGKHVIYSIPKVEITEMFGKKESDFAAYIETFEYYDESSIGYDVELWTI